MTDQGWGHHRGEALRLLEDATAAADAGELDKAETMLGLSQEHLKHFTLVEREQAVERFRGQLQNALLAHNDPKPGRP